MKKGADIINALKEAIIESNGGINQQLIIENQKVILESLLFIIERKY